MRVLASLVWATVFVQSYATSPKASVFFFDKKSEPSKAQPPSVSPSTARLLLAQRLRLSQYHSLKDADDSTVRHLNTLARIQKPIFQDEEQDETPAKLLIIVEGWEDPKDLQDSDIAGPALTISQTPSPSQNLKLVLDLFAQERYRRSHQARRCSFELSKESSIRGGTDGREEGSEYCGQERYATNHKEGDAVGELQYLVGSLTEFYDSGRTTILHISSLLELHDRIMVYQSEADKQAYIKAAGILKSAFIDIRRSPKAPELTIVLIPPPTTESKRTDYGSYDMPDKPLYARQLQSEEPLSAPEPTSTSTQSSSPSHPQPLANSTRSKRPLPVCHKTPEAAELATNNCSSHGAVYKKYSPPGDDRHECYACKCNKTVITRDDGTKKTIYWGGPACQKKDVSVPFFLLAGFTIAMLATVSWGIGLLFSIGQEELPSVIGAGVAGPRAHK